MSYLFPCRFRFSFVFCIPRLTNYCALCNLIFNSELLSAEIRCGSEDDGSRILIFCSLESMLFTAAKLTCYLRYLCLLLPLFFGGCTHLCTYYSKESLARLLYSIIDTSLWTISLSRHVRWLPSY